MTHGLGPHGEPFPSTDSRPPMPDTASDNVPGYTRAKRWLRVVGPIVGSLILLAALYRQLDVGGLRGALDSVDPLVVAVAVLPSLPFVLLKSYKWHRLAVRIAPDTSFMRSVRSFLIGTAASLVTPGRLGEFTRVVSFPERRKELLALIVVDKMVDVSVLCLLCAGVAWSYSWQLGVLACVGLGLALVVALGVRRWRHRFIDRLRHAAPAREIAANAAIGPFDGYAENEEPFLEVMRMHRDATAEIDTRQTAPSRPDALPIEKVGLPRCSVLHGPGHAPGRL
ncbi:MAG: lysylphosphatidylglycerol synthase domain-containing protein [Candidatus Poribacteria bacterium]